MAITALPSLDRTSTTFKADTDTFFGTQLPLFSVQVEAARSQIEQDSLFVAVNSAIYVDIASQAAISTGANANIALQAAGAIAWVSGTTYIIGDCRWSPIDQRIYRRKTSGAGTTDPSLDSTNWGIVSSEPAIVVVTNTATTASSGMHYVLTNSSATTLTLPAIPSSGDVVMCTVANQLRTNTVARNGNFLMTNSVGAPLAEDMLLDNSSCTLTLKFINSTYGWRLI